MAALKPRQVEAFRNVMVAGGITAAADMMNITQPAVSRLIHDLEATLQLPLFKREGTRLIPSAEATLLFREVERLYLGLDQIARAAEDIRTHKNIVLRIASVASLVRPYLHQAIIDTVGDRLNLPLVIDVENSNHILDMVENNRYDLGFVFGSPRVSEKNAVPLHNSPAVAVMTRDHPLTSRKVVTPRDLIDYRALIPGRNTPLRIELDRVFAREELTASSTIETSMLNCCHFAAAGMGVAIVDRTSVNAAEVDVVTKPFVPSIEVSYVAIRPAGSARISALDNLVDRMRQLIVQP
jgi:DNA-binding transcriptional LysR family regulator